MHIHRIHIKNIKSIRDLTWNIPVRQARGWHVVLGDNGSGKSILLKAVAAALLGPKESYGLRQPWNAWLRHGCTSGSIDLRIDWDREVDHFVGKRDLPSEPTELELGVALRQKDGSPRTFALEPQSNELDPNEHVWGSDQGWFSAAYGPFRRFTGGSKVWDQDSDILARLNRHLSLFDEGVALTSGLNWLTLFQYMSQSGLAGEQLIESLRLFVNQEGFLPSGVKLKEVTLDKVTFSDASGVVLPAQDLSDGYRSVLSMTFDLILNLMFAFEDPRQLFEPDRARFVMPTGVVLIDEIDAHLHPSWQKRIGFWLCEHFPNIQFIVSTHSPLICQAAEYGSILLLPRSGSDDKPRRLAGADFKRVVFGNVLDAYGTGVFGEEAATTRSEKSRDMRDRLAQLNTKELVKGLDEAERREQADLRAALPTAASSVE